MADEQAQGGYQPRGGRGGGFRGGRGGARGGRGRGGFKRPAAQAFGDDGFHGNQKKRTALQNNHRFLIPADLVQGIIGKGGANIKEVLDAAKQVDSEAKISIYAQCANGDKLMQGAADRVMGVQASKEGLIEALRLLVPKLQYPPPLNKKRKSEIRLMLPAHTGSAVIGKGGATCKQIKQSTDNSFIQVYTLPLPLSGEVVIRIQNFDEEKLIDAVCQVIEQAQPLKEDSPIVFYDPIWFETCAFGDTGSYIDTWWYQDAIKAGTITLTPYSKGVCMYNAGQQGGFEQQGGYQGGYEQQGYDQSYDQWGGNGYDYSQGGYDQGQQGGYDQSAYDPNAGGYGSYGGGYGGDYGSEGYQQPAAPARGGPRGGGPPRGRGRGRGGPRGAPQAARGGY